MINVVSLLAFTSALSIFSYFLHQVAFLFFLLIIVSFFISLFDKNKRVYISKDIIIMMSMLEIPFLIGVLLTNDLYFRESKDLMAMLLFSLFIVPLSAYLTDRDSQREFMYKTMNYIQYIGLFFAIFGFIKFAFLINGIKLSFLPTNHGVYGLGTSIGADNNIYALGLIVTFGIMLFNNPKKKKYFFEFFRYLMITVIVLAIILSASRRGVLFLALIIVWIWMRSMWSFFFKMITMRFKLTKRHFVFLLFILFSATIIIKSGIAKDEKIFSNITAKFETIQTLNKGEGGSFGPRIIRWKYSEELIGNYKLVQLLFGNGFRYNENFGKKFEEGMSDGYPHNILLSCIHYSGFIGLFFEFVFIYIFSTILIKSFYFYDDIEKQYCLITILITIVYLLYGLTSGNTIFEIRPLIIFSFIFMVIYNKKNDAYGLKGLVQHE